MWLKAHHSLNTLMKLLKFMSIFSSVAKSKQSVETPLYFLCTEFPLPVYTFLNIYGQRLEPTSKCTKYMYLV